MTVTKSLFQHLCPLVGLTSLAIVAFPPAATAQNVSLTEDISRVNACRRVIRDAEVFDNSSLGTFQNRVGTLNVGERVSLTGVLAPGRAQVYLSNADSTIQVLGWVDAARLTPCETAGPPIGEGNNSCYRVNTEINVRNEPSTTAPILGNYLVGDIAYPADNPPVEVLNNSQTWIRVSIFNNGIGWIARTSADGTRNYITPLSSMQCY